MLLFCLELKSMLLFCLELKSVLLYSVCNPQTIGLSSLLVMIKLNWIQK